MIQLFHREQFWIAPDVNLDVARVTPHDGMISCGTLRGSLVDNRFVSFTIRDDVIVIYDPVFEGSKGLISVTLPAELLCIASSVFNGCANLTSITLPEDLDEIDPAAFINCNNLSIVICSQNIYNRFKSCAFLDNVWVVSPDCSFLQKSNVWNHDVRLPEYFLKYTQAQQVYTITLLSFGFDIIYLDRHLRDNLYSDLEDVCRDLSDALRWLLKYLPGMFLGDLKVVSLALYTDYVGSDQQLYEDRVISYLTISDFCNLKAVFQRQLHPGRQMPKGWLSRAVYGTMPGLLERKSRPKDAVRFLLFTSNIHRHACSDDQVRRERYKANIFSSPGYAAYLFYLMHWTHVLGDHLRMQLAIGLMFRQCQLGDFPCVVSSLGDVWKSAETRCASELPADELRGHLLWA